MLITRRSWVRSPHGPRSPFFFHPSPSLPPKITPKITTHAQLPKCKSALSALCHFGTGHARRPARPCTPHADAPRGGTTPPGALPTALPRPCDHERVRTHRNKKKRTAGSKRWAMIPPGIEPGTFCVRSRRDNRYTTESVHGGAASETRPLCPVGDGRVPPLARRGEGPEKAAVPSDAMHPSIAQLVERWTVGEGRGGNP